jgi:single-strand DNA-binding protein
VEYIADRKGREKNEMNNLNSILIEGNLVNDAELRQTPKGVLVCNLRVANNRFFKGDEGLEKEVSFFDIEAWSKLAESCQKQGKKGRGIRVVGRLKQDRWQDNEGKGKSRIFIVAEHIEFKPEYRPEQKPDKSKEADSYER